MTQFLTSAEAKAYHDADVENLIPVGEYRVRIMSVEPRESDPETKCFKFKVLIGPYRGRVLRAWPSTAPDRIWTLRRLIGEVVVDPTTLQLEDLEGHIFRATVSIEARKDTGENTNRVNKLISCDESLDEAMAGDDEDPPF